MYVHLTGSAETSARSTRFLAFTYYTLRFRFAFVPNARDADLRGANDQARSLILGFKAILRGASEGTEGSHVTTVEQFTQDGLLRFYEDMDDRAAFATLHA